MTTCDQIELIRDYAFDEIPAHRRADVEHHMAGCPTCAAELDQLRLTTAALRILPEQEIPQRITFVTDQPATTGFFASFWNSSARLGFASACMVAVALTANAWHRPVEVRTIIQSSSVQGSSVATDLSKQIDDAVSKAVQQVKFEDAQLTRAALDAAEIKHEREHRLLMTAMEQNLEVMQKRMGTQLSLASLEVPASGGGQ